MGINTQTRAPMAGTLDRKHLRPDSLLRAVALQWRRSPWQLVNLVYFVNVVHYARFCTTEAGHG